MLYDLVAEHFGLTNDADLQSAVDASGTSILDWIDGGPTLEARRAVLNALNNQTDVMIEREINNPQSMVDLIKALADIPGVFISNFPNRKARRKAKAEKKA